MEETDKKRRIAASIQNELDPLDLKWFVAFGTLLSLVRDKCFSISQDIDICVVGEIDSLFKSKGTDIKSYIKNDTNGDILKMTYDYLGISIDIFRMVFAKGLYWHTYDYFMEFPKDGIPSKYVFKGLPREVCDCPQEKIKKIQDDMKYYNQGRPGLSKHGTWSMYLPECPGDGIVLQLPFNYGMFLDYAYPDWVTTRTQFGQSVGYNQIEATSCERLC